jgi:hypothetical protein
LRQDFGIQDGILLGDQRVALDADARQRGGQGAILGQVALR